MPINVPLMDKNPDEGQNDLSQLIAFETWISLASIPTLTDLLIQIHACT